MPAIVDQGFFNRDSARGAGQFKVVADITGRPRDTDTWNIEDVVAHDRASVGTAYIETSCILAALSASGFPRQRAAVSGYNVSDNSSLGVQLAV